MGSDTHVLGPKVIPVCWALWVVVVVVVGVLQEYFLKKDQRIPHAHLEGNLRALELL